MNSAVSCEETLGVADRFELLHRPFSSSRRLVRRFCHRSRESGFFTPAAWVRDIAFSHEAVGDWEAKLTPALAEELRRRRRGQIGRSWYVDETYVKVHGRWRYLYRAVDRDGALVDVMLSERRDLAAAKGSFRSARTVTGVVPGRVTTDRHDACPAAIRRELGEAVRHRTSVYLNNRLEQDHRGIKDRYGPMRGFKNVGAARRFCLAFDELRSFLRVRAFHRQQVSADRRPLRRLRRTVTVHAIIEVAWHFGGRQTAIR
jgi:transposase-like protein